MQLECGKCGHIWRERISLPMRLDAFVSRVKGMLVCPNCGFKPRLNGKVQIYMYDNARGSVVNEADKSTARQGGPE